MPALRLFLTIDIPPHARETVVSIQNRFKTLDLNASWVRPGNIHLTLKFLGDTPSEWVAEIRKIVPKAVELFPVFKVDSYKVYVIVSYSQCRSEFGRLHVQ